MSDETRTNIYIPVNLKREIKKAASRHRPPMSFSGYVRTAAVEKIDRENKKNG